jgi:hypothetical protein
MLSLERNLRCAPRSVLAHLAVAILVPACDPGGAPAPPNTAVEARSSQQASGGYAVTWKPTLLEFVGPDGPGDKDQSTLAARLQKSWEDAIQVTSGEGALEVRTCRALLDLGKVYEPVVASEFDTYRYRKAHCRAAALVAHARPSRTSFVHTFALDVQAPGRLPAAVAFSVSPEDDQRVVQAAAQGKPWSAVEDVHLVEQVSPEEARYGANASEQLIVIAGRGDFNGDSIEDLVLLSAGRLTEGSLESTRLFLVTRGSDDEPTLRLLLLE